MQRPILRADRIKQDAIDDSEFAGGRRGTELGFAEMGEGDEGVGRVPTLDR